MLLSDRYIRCNCGNLPNSFPLFGFVSHNRKGEIMQDIDEGEHIAKKDKNKQEYVITNARALIMA